MKNELYASLELQITMAQDYAEWLKQETKRNDELLNAHSAALRRLNDLMVQLPSEKEDVDSGRGEDLPDGLKWEDAPEWADKLASASRGIKSKYYLWCNSLGYMYTGSGDFFLFSIFGNKRLDQLDIIATRPEGA